MEENLNAKLDAIDKKLNFLIDEIEIQKRHRQEFNELKDDLLRVSKELYTSAVYELEEVHDHINTGDMLFLFKKLLRNINNISSALDKFESMGDLIKDVSPISREIIVDFMYKLDDFDKKGYFTFIKNVSIVFDEIIKSLPKDRISDFKEQIPNILKFIELFSDPVVLNKLLNVANTLKTSCETDVKNISTIKLSKELLSKESKSAMYKLVQVLKELK